MMFDSDSDDDDDDTRVGAKRGGVSKSTAKPLPRSPRGRFSSSEQGSESDGDFCVLDAPTSTRVVCVPC